MKKLLISLSFLFINVSFSQTHCLKYMVAHVHHTSETNVYNKIVYEHTFPIKNVCNSCLYFDYQISENGIVMSEEFNALVLKNEVARPKYRQIVSVHGPRSETTTTRIIITDVRPYSGPITACKKQ